MADEPKKLEWTALLKKLSDLEVGKPLDVSVQKETIPIVFVPGIMGSRLAKSGEKILGPGRQALHALELRDGVGRRRRQEEGARRGQLRPHGPRAARGRRRPQREVRRGRRPDAAGVGDRREAGLGDRLVGNLRRAAHEAAGEGDVPRYISSLLRLPGVRRRLQLGGLERGRGEGAREADRRIVDHHQSKDGLCKQVIVVTHSMGGLVARWAVEKEGAKDKVLGVVHGVQPATGAAAAYWRMKAGFERTKRFGFEFPNPAAWVLGTNGEEVTALLGWMPGGLQLLPGPDYTDNAGSKKWLRLCDHEGKELAAYGDDAYERITRTRIRPRTGGSSTRRSCSPRRSRR